MDEAAVIHYLLNTFDDVQTSENFGYTFFFYGADRMLPFATLASSDNEYDRVSQLDRPGIFRLNVGVSKSSFQALLGNDNPDVANYDFTALDTFMPHPDYAAQSWFCILSPSAASFETLKPLLAEAYERAVKRERSRTSQK